MRRLILSLMFSSAAFLVACEDGPAQTFSPAPEGAGSVWNNGNTPGPAGDAGKDFTGAGSAGQNANIICNPEKKKAVWATMVHQPFFPPSVAGNIDVAGGTDKKGTFLPDPAKNAQQETWTGLTLDDAEKINCQSTFAGDAYGDGSFYYAAWGDNQEVAVLYRVSNRQIYTVLLQTGYLGQLTATSRDGQHKYVIKVDGTPLQKDGNPFLFDWTSTDPIPGDTAPGHNNGKLGELVNELYDAMTATYSALGAETDCIASGHCIVNNFGDQGAYVWFTPLGFTFYVQTTNGGPVVGSTPIQINQDKKKLLGYSFADALLQFDDVGLGPTGTQLNVFGSGKNCNLRMDMPFSEFRDNCVAPVSDPTKNSIELAKLFGGFGHGDESYSFDVAGIDPNFSALQPQSLADNDVIRDQDKPKDNDPLTSIRIDQESGGQIRNDFVNNDTTKAQDWHGSGLVMLEWANLVQKWFQDYNAAKGSATKIGLGDPRCLTATPIAGCTGMEGIVTTAPVAAIDAATLAANPGIKTNALGAAATARFSKLNIGLKPAAWHSFFCTDAKKSSTCAGFGNNDSFFQTAYNQLVKVAGGGQAGTLPIETQDVRFLFKQWIFALVKYLQVADNPNATLAQVDAAPIDTNNLFFDAIGSGQFELAEYVDRHNANKGQDPIDLEFTVDVLHGIFNDYTFVRHLRRGESLIYSAMRETASDHLGYENTAVLTNFAGSPVLAAAYPSYVCATNTDPNNAACIPAGAKTAIVAPQDPTTGAFLRLDNGDLILKPYKGAWGKTPFTVGTISPITVDLTGVPNFIQSAKVTVPIFKDPYDVTSDPLTPVTKLIPWFPKAATIGFSVPINGQQEKFIETYTADFSGVTISANVDYDIAKDPTTQKPVGLQIKAIETTDFLGEVFPCMDPDTGELLRVRMYTSAKTILDWFSQHPNASASCGMIFRYSPYGNYLDFITSSTNGVRLSINPGAGGGRVVDAVLFDPTVIGQ